MSGAYKYRPQYTQNTIGPSEREQPAQGEPRMRCPDYLGPFRCELESGHHGKHKFDSPRGDSGISAEQVTAKKWLRVERPKTDGRIHYFFDTLGKFMYVEELLESYAALKTRRAESALKEMRSKVEKTAKVLLDHLNDDDYEMSLAGLYAYLTEEPR